MSNPAKPNLPVNALSGHGDAPIELRSPLTASEELRRAIRDWLNAPDAGATADSTTTTADDTAHTADES